MINHRGYSNLYIANAIPVDKVEKTKIIVFRYRFDKSLGTHVFEEFRGTFKDGFFKTFVPDGRPTDRWYFTNSVEGQINHERIWYNITGKTEKEIDKLRKNFIERMIESKKAYLHRLESSIEKVNNDLEILENYKSNLN